MLKYFFTFLLIFTSLFTVLAQEKDKELTAFFKEFRAAMTKQDKEKMADLIQFPLKGNNGEEYFLDGGKKYLNTKEGFIEGGYKTLFNEESISIFNKLTRPKNKGFMIKFNQKPYEVNCGFTPFKDYLLLNSDDTDILDLEGYMLENALYYKEGDAGYSFIYFFAKIDNKYKLVKFYLQ